MPVRIGLVGVGRWGEVHLRKLLELRSRGVAEPSGIHDVDRDRARLVSREYGVPSMELDELLRESDGVIVATPPSAHHRVAMKAIERGLPVLVEKPMTNDPRRAEEIVRAARSRGVEVLVGYVERFNPAVGRLKEIVSSGEIGKAVFVSARRIGPRGRRVRDVGVILDLATHDIDVSRFVLGEEPRTVLGMYGSLYGEYEDYAVILMRYPSALCVVQTNLLTPYKIRDIAVTGAEGYVHVDYIARVVELCREGERVVEEVRGEEPLISELAHFARVVEGRERPLCDGEEGLRTLRIAYEALRHPGVPREIRL